MKTMGTAVFWTSTKAPLWQVDCEEFRKLQSPFELREIEPQHQRFVRVYAERFGLEVTHEGSAVMFNPGGKTGGATSGGK